MVEMQKAVTLAERRALDSVMSERIKMERLLMEAASVSATSASTISSSSMANKTRKVNTTILDSAINSEGLENNAKMINDNEKQGNHEDFTSLQSNRENEDINVGDCVVPEKSKVRFCIFYILD